MLWQGVTRLQILCLVATDQGIDRGRLNRGVCERARAIAALGAPMPVAIIEPGDPAVLDPSRVTLLVHVSVQREAPGALAALSVRPYRNDGGTPPLFAAAPQAVRLSSTDAEGAALDPALRNALNESLSWLARPGRSRPIRR